MVSSVYIYVDSLKCHLKFQVVFLFKGSFTQSNWGIIHIGSFILIGFLEGTKHLVSFTQCYWEVGKSEWVWTKVRVLVGVGG